MSQTPKAAASLTLVKKGLVLMAIPLLAQLVFLAVLLKTRQDYLSAQNMSLHSKNVLAQTEAAFRLLLEARSSVRSLTLTGDLQFAQRWKRTRTEVSAALQELHEMVADNPPQQDKVAEIRRQVEKALVHLDGIRELAEKAETRGQALAELRGAWALHFVDELRARFDDILVEEGRLDTERQTKLESAMRRQDLALIGGACLAVLSTLTLAYVFGRGIAARLAVLSANAERLAVGEALAAPLGGGDELAQLDRRFHEMAEALAQKDRENEMFVYSVSHDLRSPLVNLQGFSQELALVCQDLRRTIADSSDLVPAVRERMVGLIDRDASESIHFIQTAVNRLAAIIDALLRLSRVGRVVYEWQPVEVRSVVERVVKALANTIAHKKARVRIGELPPAWGDPTAIEQVFANLIGNALNYLDPARPGEIDVGCQDTLEVGGLRKYYVKDNGLGIVAEHLPKLFLAFQRLHPNAAPGEGIGLSLVRRMVERHGGRISVESVVGQGSTFFVTLPVQPLDGRSAGEERIGVNRLQQKKNFMSAEPLHVVLAEDDEGHATLIHRNLERAGLVNGFSRVKDGQELLDLMRGEGEYVDRPLPPSNVLLLLDINMPRLDGVEVLRRLKADARTASVPVIMLTTTDDPREIERCYQLGCSVYVTKPVEYSTFIEAIKRLGLFLQVVRVPRNGPANRGK